MAQLSAITHAWPLHTLSGGKFAAAWVPLVLASAATNAALRVADPAMFDLGGGFAVPVVSGALGLLGIVLSRPLARKAEAERGVVSFVMVSLIMLIVVELWISESRPSGLFAFALAVGLGFSGYSLIELVSEQIRGTASDTIGKLASIARLLGDRFKGGRK